MKIPVDLIRELGQLERELGRGTLTVDSFRNDQGKLVEDDDFFRWIHIVSCIRAVVEAGEKDNE